MRIISVELPLGVEHESRCWQETLLAMDSVAKSHVVSGEVVHIWLDSWGGEDELSPPQVD